MLRNDHQYRRLKVSARGSIVSASYWLGPDQLLVVQTSGFSEQYQRFAFNDIQALIIRGTDAQRWMNTLLAVLTAGSVLAIVLIYLLQPRDDFSAGAVFGVSLFGVLSVILGVWWLVNWRR